MTIERYGLFETCVKGPSEGNPFTEQSISAVFKSKNETIETAGFYDGQGRYKVRFMPSFVGEYEYEIRTSFGAEEKGSFTVTEPGEGNHGPVHTAEQYHFAYADGTPYYSLGTTCYVFWLQEDEIVEQTFETLKNGPFNKIRFCVFPKHYIHNFKDPVTFPYEGHAGDRSWLNEENFSYFMEVEGNDFDLTRFNLAHFQRLDRTIERLMDLGIEADIIVMHPYDCWGFSHMTREQDDLYWKYVIARYSAYRNVWWSLANEYDLLFTKKLEDWEHYAELLCRLDPYQHLRSVHHCRTPYDFTRPWITHVSYQRIDLYKSAELGTELRERYGKPVVFDEIAYEGNIDNGWGNISGEEMTRRFWEAALRGTYPGHGETYANEDDILWWSHGGKLHGTSPERILFLKKIIEETPGHGLKFIPESWDAVTAVPETVLYTGQYKIIYFSFMQPSFRILDLPKDKQYRIEIIDTWNMTVTDGGTHSGWTKIQLPGRPYMALRLTLA